MQSSVSLILAALALTFHSSLIAAEEMLKIPQKEMERRLEMTALKLHADFDWRRETPCLPQYSICGFDIGSGVKIRTEFIKQPNVHGLTTYLNLKNINSNSRKVYTLACRTILLTVLPNLSDKQADQLTLAMTEQLEGKPKKELKVAGLVIYGALERVDIGEGYFWCGIFQE